MIVYGRRATTLKTQVLFDPCPNCKSTNSVHLTIYGRYAHIFWIPMFPIGKTGVSVCSNCRQVLKSKDMPPDLRLAYDNMKSGTKPPFWHFSGLALIALIIIAVNISDKQKGEKVGQWILAPKAGDIYELKVDDTTYTLYKVEAIEADTVFFTANEFQSSDETGLSSLYSKPFDSSMTYGISRKALIKMHSKDEIVDITRK